MRFLKKLRPKVLSEKIYGLIHFCFFNDDHFFTKKIQPGEKCEKREKSFNEPLYIYDKL